MLLGGDPTKENTLGHKPVDYCRTTEMREMIEQSAKKVSVDAEGAHYTWTSSLARAATSIIFVATDTCCDKTRLLS